MPRNQNINYQKNLLYSPGDLEVSRAWYLQASPSTGERWWRRLAPVASLLLKSFVPRKRKNQENLLATAIASLLASLVPLLQSCNPLNHSTIKYSNHCIIDLWTSERPWAIEYWSKFTKILLISCPNHAHQIGVNVVRQMDWYHALIMFGLDKTCSDILL